LFGKTIADYLESENPYAELAENRVIASPELSPYHDLLIEYDWPNHDGHWLWVATAPVEELVKWAADIRQYEADEAEEDEPIEYALAVARTITMYPDQWAVVDRLAADKHRGKASPAVQEIVDDYKNALGVGGMR